MCPSTESRPRPMVTIDTCVPPARCRRVDFRGEFADLAPGQHHIRAAEAFCRPAVLAHQLPDPMPGVDGVVGAAAEEDEAVAKPRGPLQRLLTGSAKPDPGPSVPASAAGQLGQPGRSGRRSRQQGR